MQPQHNEVHVKNDEYEREQQRLAKQIKRVVILINGHILAFCAVQKCAHVLKLFQRNTYTLPSFSNLLHFVTHALASFPGSCVPNPHTSLGTRLCTCMTEKHMPRLLTYLHVLVQRSWRCAQGILCEYVHL